MVEFIGAAYGFGKGTGSGSAHTHAPSFFRVSGRGGSNSPRLHRAIERLEQKIRLMEKERLKYIEAQKQVREASGTGQKNTDLADAIVRYGVDGICMLDSHGRLVSVNARSRDLFGITHPDTYAGMDFRYLWGHEYAQVISRAVAKAQSGETGRFSGIKVSPHGTETHVDVLIVPVPGEESETRFLAICRDVTDIQELETHKDDFVSATSHELKTPLTSQRAFLDLLEREMFDANLVSLLPLLGKIRHQTDKLTRLVNVLLDGSRMRGGSIELRKEPTDLNMLLRQVIRDMQLVCETHVIYLQGSAHKRVLVDHEKITQVLMNLLANAIKYSPQSYLIDIRLEECGRSVVIHVTDYGIGIPQKHIPHIFGRFYRAPGGQRSTYPGLGMGLFIASEIVRRHRGKIWVRSSGRKGTTFSFSLPAV